MGKLVYDEHTGEPIDRRMHVYLTTILCGTAMLLPYNAFIAVPPYVEKYYRYASDDPDYLTSMPSIWANIENYLMVASLVPNFLAQCSMLTSWGRSLRIYPRLIIGAIVMVVAVLCVIIVPLFKVREEVALFTLISATVVVNIAAAIFQASMFSFAAMFPFHITQGLMLGVGVSGSTASVMASVIKAAMQDTFTANQEKAQVYFGLAGFILFLAFVSLLVLKKNPYAQHCCLEMRPEEYFEEDPLINDDEDDNYDDSTGGTFGAAQGSNLTPAGGGGLSPVTPTDGGDNYPLGMGVKSPSGLLKAKSNSGLGGMGQKSASTLTATESVMMYTDVPSVIKKILPMLAAVFWVYLVSLFVFPSFGVKLHATDNWFPVLIILMFNVGDFSGRFLCRFSICLLSRKAVLIGCGVRTFLVLGFFLQVPANAIDSKAFAYCLMYAVGITNGYYSTQVMMLTPSTEGLEDDGDRGVAGNAMSVALLGGAAAGSLVSLAIVPQLG